MRTTSRSLFSGILCAALAACGGSGTPAPAPTCGFPPPVPQPILLLSYPIPNATNVPDAFGTLIFTGEVADFFGPTTVTLASASSVNVPIGAYTAAPSPLPSPTAIPSVPGLPIVAVPVPTLSPATTYTVTFNWPDFGNTPPACRTTNTTNLGSFTTR